MRILLPGPLLIPISAVSTLTVLMLKVLMLKVLMLKVQIVRVSICTSGTPVPGSTQEVSAST